MKEEFDYVYDLADWLEEPLLKNCKIIKEVLDLS